MAGTFEELGIRSGLIEAARANGFARPAPLQAGAVPVLRRGGNVVLHASAGAGIVGTYALGLLDRLGSDGEQPGGEPEPPTGPRIVLLTPTTESAARIALSLARFAGAIDRRVVALAPGWPAAASGADVLVGTPAAVLGQVEAARLKLHELGSLVLHDASELFELGHGEAVETLTGSVPAEAQRVLASADLGDDAEDYIERHVRRALRFPPRAAEPDATDREPSGTVDYVVVTDGAKLEAIAELIGARANDGADGTVPVHCRTEAAVSAVIDALALRGFRAAREPADALDARVTTSSARAGDAAPISFDVPFDGEELAGRHEAAGGTVIIAPRELPHLRRIAGAAGLRTRAARMPAGERLRSELEAYRERLREAVAARDIGAQLLVLEPLLAEFSALELAAAASALARQRAPLEAPRAEAAAAEPAAAASSAPAPAPPESATAQWVRLFMSIGRKDNIRPGDLVGAITGEAQVDGGRIGRIDIRDTFSIVEVAGEIADKVIRTMNGITMKGRSLRVDYDRRDRPAGRGSGRGRR